MTRMVQQKAAALLPTMEANRALSPLYQEAYTNTLSPIFSSERCHRSTLSDLIDIVDAACERVTGCACRQEISPDERQATIDAIRDICFACSVIPTESGRLREDGL